MFFVAYGSEWCGHFHRTESGAERCLGSDRRIVRVRKSPDGLPLDRPFREARPVREAVEQLGPSYATPYFLRLMGYSTREIEAAVRAGEVHWTRDGRLVEAGPRLEETS